MPTVADLVRVLEDLAPLELAEEWDNTGLLLGDAAWDVSSVLTCLTLTADVAAEAVRTSAQLVVTHHPILFRPVQRLVAHDPQGAMLLLLSAAGVAVYSPHTRYDNAPQGINQQWAERFGLRNIAPLRTRPTPLIQLVTFVPPSHLTVVQEALWAAGAGRIGEYSRCSFALLGTGTFQGSEHSHPAAGTPGEFEQLQEVRLEVAAEAGRLTALVAALRAAHPYEEPAYGIYQLQAMQGPHGAGRTGDLPQPVSLAEFTSQVRQNVPGALLQVVGESSTAIRRMAVACGSAAEFIPDAVAAKCDVLLTGEARFHDCLKARDAGLALVLTGHYASERPGVERLAEQLQAQFPGLTIRPSAAERDPLCS